MDCFVISHKFIGQKENLFINIQLFWGVLYFKCPGYYILNIQDSKGHIPIRFMSNFLQAYPNSSSELNQVTIFFLVIQNMHTYTLKKHFLYIIHNMMYWTDLKGLNMTSAQNAR